MRSWTRTASRRPSRCHAHGDLGYLFRVNDRQKVDERIAADKAARESAQDS